MDKKKLEELRNYYDNTDTTEDISDADLDTEIVESPMVGITVRLPQDLLQAVREAATQEGIKTTALIRRWIEDQMQPTRGLAESSLHFEFASVFTISTGLTHARPEEELAVARALARA